MVQLHCMTAPGFFFFFPGSLSVRLRAANCNKPQALLRLILPVLTMTA